MRIAFTLLLAWAAAAPAFAQSSSGFELVEVKKIWDQGKHNAFTDLLRFKDRWYCVFREGDGHVGGDGKIRVLTSPDGKGWEPAALLTEKGIPGSDIKVETNKGVVSLSSTTAITESQKKMAIDITKKIKGVKAVSADGLKAE